MCHNQNNFNKSIELEGEMQPYPNSNIDNIDGQQNNLKLRNVLIQTSTNPPQSTAALTKEPERPMPPDTETDSDSQRPVPPDTETESQRPMPSENETDSDSQRPVPPDTETESQRPMPPENEMKFGGTEELSG